MRVLIATMNDGKLREYQRLLAGVSGLELQTMASLAQRVDVDEDRDTFEGNALKKAMRSPKWRASLAWRTTAGSRSMRSAVGPGCTPRDTPEKVRPTRATTRSYWKSSRPSQTPSERPAFVAPSRSSMHAVESSRP